MHVSLGLVLGISVKGAKFHNFRTPTMHKVKFMASESDHCEVRLSTEIYEIRVVSDFGKLGLTDIAGSFDF